MGFSYIIQTKYFLFQELEKLQKCLLLYLSSHFLFICFLECYFWVEILRPIWAKSVIWTITLPSIIETWTVFLPIILLQYNFQKHILQYTNLILNALLEHTWTLVSLFMMRSCTYPAISLSWVIVQLKVNVEVCIYCKNCLPLNVLNIKFLHEHIAFDLQSGD